MKHYSSRLVPFGIAVVIVIGVWIGSFYSNHFSSQHVSFINTTSNKVSDLLHIIDERYVDTINLPEFVERAIPQILKELDPHSTYVTAKDVEESMQDLKGSFSGIGIRFTTYEDTVRVVHVIKGGPSERVGLRPGDRIVTIDGKTYVGKDVSNDKTIRLLKGPDRSEVTIGVKRLGEKELLSFKITRGTVPVKSIDASYMMNQATGYLRITSWGETTYQEFLAAMANLHSQGMESLVIDLRGNLGGYLQAAVQVANEFLPRNSLIVYNEGHKFPREDYKSDGRGASQSLPLVVMVDETSASASEIFAGAMQDNDRAIIIGRRTFGKGLVQVPIEFRDGSMLRLTTARYYTPSGRSLQKPFVAGEDEDYEADLLERAATGEYYSSDSIKTSGKTYKTRLGRKVYGGGGIIPDEFVARDTTGFNSYFKEVYLQGTIYQFAYWYVDQNRKTLSSLSSPVAIAKHLQQKKIVQLFADYAERHGTRRRNVLIAESHKLLLQQITSLVLIDVLDTPAAVEFSNATDPFIKRALDVFKRKASFPQAETKPNKAVAHSLPPRHDQTRNSLYRSATQTAVALRESPDRRSWTVAKVFARTRRLLRC